MRDMKFRAWNKKHKTWFEYRSGLAVNLDGVLVCPSSDKQLLPVSDEFELSQFTGLHDRNGLEIYEGDIVEGSYIVPLYDEDMELAPREEWSREKQRGAIIFTNGMFWIKGKNALGGNMYNEFDYEVVGNIYENPNQIK